MTARVLLIVVAIGCGVPERVPHVPLWPCAIAGVGEPLRCGTLSVPEDRAHPEGRHLALPIIVVPATTRAGGVPLFELLGGPGAAATLAAPAFASELAALRQVGDVVLIDQRGTGVGPSSLACPELDDISADVVPDAAARRHCRDSLAQRADLRFYGTVEVARDLEDARIALGYERINIEALSYGTRLAQTYMRMFPARVHAAVLFGTLPPDAHIPDEFAENAQRVADMIVDRAQLNAIALPSRISRAAFTEWIRHRMYSAEGAAGVPKLIAAAAAGDFAAFKGAPALGERFRNALNLTITCSEDIPAINVPAATARARQTWFGSVRLEMQLEQCAEWPRFPVDPTLYEPVATDVPVLAIAGERDPVTPPSYADRATKRMTHAQLVRVPALAHEPDIGTDCLLAIELTFLRAPLQRVDASCVSSIRLPAG